MYRILTNKAYIGKKDYKERGEIFETDTVWSALIEDIIFRKVQKKLKSNKSTLKPPSKNRYPYLLTGITFCEKCKSPLSGKSAWGKNKKVPYYEHCWSTKKNSNLAKKVFDCGNHRRFSGKKLEELVVAKTLKLMASPAFSKRLLEKVNSESKKEDKSKTEIKRLKDQVYNFNSQIDALAERLATMPVSVNATPIYKQMERLEALKVETADKVKASGEDGVNAPSVPIELKNYQEFLKGLKTVFTDAAPEKIRKRILHKLIHRIEVDNDFVNIHFNVDNLTLRDPMDVGSLFLCDNAKVTPLILDKKNPSTSLSSLGGVEHDTMFQSRCSNSLLNGSGRGT